MKRMKQVGFVVASLAAAGVALGQAVKVDPKLPSYSKASGVSGNLSSVGSDTMNNMVTLWGEAFRRLYPNVKVQVEGKGSSTAPPALIEGTAQVGPMSRKMKKDGFRCLRSSRKWRTTWAPPRAIRRSRCTCSEIPRSPSSATGGASDRS